MWLNVLCSPLSMRCALLQLFAKQVVLSAAAYSDSLSTSTRAVTAQEEAIQFKTNKPLTSFDASECLPKND